MALHQKPTVELGGNLLGGAREEGLGEVLGGRGGYWEKAPRKPHSLRI